METTTNNTKQGKFEKLEKNHQMLAHFAKFYGQDQQGKNDYETGCIQTANILVPVILELLLND